MSSHTTEKGEVSKGTRRFRNRTWILILAGTVLVALGFFSMYISGFLLHPNGYMVCNAACTNNIQFARAEYWSGLGSTILGLGVLVTGVLFSLKRTGNSNPTHKENSP